MVEKRNRMINKLIKNKEEEEIYGGNDNLKKKLGEGRKKIEKCVRKREMRRRRNERRMRERLMMG